VAFAVLAGRESACFYLTYSIFFAVAVSFGSRGCLERENQRCTNEGALFEGRVLKVNKDEDENK
jgi:hypothetical protein